MSQLTQLLNKKGIQSEEDLSVEEKEVFNRYKKVLSQETVTLDSIKDFCQSQIQIIQGKCDGVTGINLMQQACMHVYINIIKAIEAPQAERKSLEKYLEQLIK